jgi:hypothetical protein
MRIGYTVRGCAVSLTVLLLGQACGVSSPRAIPTATPGQMPNWRDEGDFAIGAEALTWSGQRAVVGTKLLVMNRASRPVMLRRSRITLDLPDGTRLYPVGPATIAGVSPRVARVAGAGELCLVAPLCAIALLILVGSLASAIARPAAEAAYQARVREYEATSFPDMAFLETGQRAEGFVFFQLPETVGGSSGIQPETARRGRTFEGEPKIEDLPPPWLRATVANLAGSRPPVDFVLHLEVEDGEGLPRAEILTLPLSLRQ